jgi:Short C-terminal domain
MNPMKKLFVPLLVGLSALMLFTGCLGLQVGGGTSNRTQAPTLGQQLIDLQKAKDAGIITQAEYEAQKAKMLANNK